MDQFQNSLKQQFPASQITNQGFWQSGADINSDAADLAITPLSQYSLLSVVGPDGHKFLQGQTTCDWNKITPYQAGLGSYCNIKGRVVSSFLGFVTAEEHIQLRLRGDILDSSREILSKYIVFSKAKLHVNHEQLIGLGVFGAEARQALTQFSDTLPESRWQSVTNNGITFIQTDDEGQRFECWATEDQALALWDALSKSAAVADSDRWEQTNIEAGIAEVCAATQDTFLPQMLNYQRVGAVSFTKGCYTGQEIVARMEYRGKLKRRMYRASFGDAAPAPGADLFQGDGSQSIGNVVSAVNTKSGSVLLAVLTEEAVAAADIHLAESTSRLKIEGLPYSVGE